MHITQYNFSAGNVPKAQARQFKSLLVIYI
jgi:hypothetical protein